jgi:predicted component of type VI protein secretion system
MKHVKKTASDVANNKHVKVAVRKAKNIAKKVNAEANKAVGDVRHRANEVASRPANTKDGKRAVARIEQVKKAIGNNKHVKSAVHKVKKELPNIRRELGLNS